MNLCRVCSIRPSPPSATITSALAGSALPYRFSSRAQASRASGVWPATKAMVLNWFMRGLDDGTRGARLYDLALDCRGGAGGARHRRGAACGLREYPAGDDLALLVAGQNRERRGGRYALQA